MTKEWEEIGFQGADPATDFVRPHCCHQTPCANSCFLTTSVLPFELQRAMGMLGLLSLVTFGQEYAESARKTLFDAGYPLAITGIKVAGLICASSFSCLNGTRAWF
jgi:hypothetical protein